MLHIFDSNAKREYGVLILFTIILLGLILPSLAHARREHRDGIVRDQVAALKRNLEDMNNKKKFYPLQFPQQISPYEYIVTKSNGNMALEWYIRGQLENYHEQLSAYDAEEGHNFWYRYVNIQGKTYYDICGGTPRCDVPR